jgi:hypothetical protein
VAGVGGGSLDLALGVRDSAVERCELAVWLFDLAVRWCGPARRLGSGRCGAAVWVFDMAVGVRGSAIEWRELAVWAFDMAMGVRHGGCGA